MARCIRGKVIAPVPARRVGHGVAAFVGAADTEIAFVDGCGMMAWGEEVGAV